MILIPSFTQMTWNKLSQTCTWYFLSSDKWQRKFSSSPSSLTASSSHSGVQVCLQMLEGQEELWKLGAGECRYNNCAEETPWFSKAAESWVFLCWIWERGIRPVFSNRGNDWWLFRNLIGQPWRRMKEGQKMFFSFSSLKKSFGFFSPSDSTKLESIKLNILFL